MDETRARRVVDTPIDGSGDVVLADESLAPKWGVFRGYEDIAPGTSGRVDGALVWSVSPGAWTVLGPERPDAVDLTHVRAMFRLTGDDGPDLLARICALDLDDRMFGRNAAARTLVAGVATEVVRDDVGGARSYLLLPSRSFGRYVLEVVVDAGGEFGLSVTV